MLTIHGVPISVHTRKVILAARLKKVEHAVDPVIPFDPPAGWSAKSPTGLIPAITAADGFTLADSSAIVAYLERMHPTRRSTRPSREPWPRPSSSTPMPAPPCFAG